MPVAIGERHLIQNFVAFYFTLSGRVRYFYAIGFSSEALKIESGAADKLGIVVQPRLILLLAELLYTDRFVDHAHRESFDASAIAFRQLTVQF